MVSQKLLPLIDRDSAGLPSDGVGDELIVKGMQLEHLTLTGRPENYSASSSAGGTAKRSGLEANQTHGFATHVVARELETRLCSGQRERHEHEHTADMGTKYSGATTRRALLALMPLWFGERFWMVTTTADGSTADHCWWIFSHVNQVVILVFVFYLCVHLVKITRGCRRLETSTY